jgi:hypothetical protein
LVKNWKRNKIKSDVIKGKQHFAHKIANLILETKQTLNFDCFCKTKSESFINWESKFSIYNALNSDWEEYLFLKWLVIAIDNEDKKILKFDYYIELKSQQNEV